MVHLSTATPERFSALADNPVQELERLRNNLARGAVRPEHLVVASDDDVDVARLGLYTHEDGTTVTYADRLDPTRPDVEQVYATLLDGIARAARSTGLARVHATVVDRDEPVPQVKRAALLAAGWELDGDRLELAAPAARRARTSDIVEVDPGRPEVVAVMAAAMVESLDDHDREQVATLGAEAAAASYRDMMADPDASVPWLAHRGPEGIDAIAAIMVFPDDWCLGYLGVAPAARRGGVGTALGRAMLSATADAGVALATASVAVANHPIRRTLEKVGFTIHSPRTDFLLRLARD